MRTRTKLACAAAILAVCVGLVAATFDRLVIAALTPDGAFDPAMVPSAPVYADPAHWSALPARVDADDVAVQTLPTIDPALAPVGVFYVHPTSYVGRDWNGGLGDATIDGATDRGATRIQASAFRGCCSIHAPRYRQANLTAFTHPSEDGQRAIALAGDDVVAAFRYFLEHDARGRPFIIAGHSQGAVLGLRVLTEVVVGDGLQDRLVAAYLIGSSLTEATLEAIPGLAACESATQTGCVIGFNARSADYSDGLDLVEFPPPPPGTAPPRRLCVNPLTWRHDDAPGDAALHRGAVFFDGDAPPSPVPRFTSARCHEGTLVVELAGPVPRDFMSKLLDFALGVGNYHPIEFGLFFVDIRDNAAERVRAYLAQSPPH